MTRLLLLSIGLFVGVYRIDLAYGKGGFMVTPILILSILFTAFFSVKMFFRKVKLPENITYLFVLLFVLISWMMLNIDYDDLIQVKRLILFAFLLITGTFLNIAIFNDPNPRRIFVIFCTLSVAVFTILTAIQFIFFFNDTFFSIYNNEASMIELRPLSVGESFPRITGGFFDPNVAGYFLIFIYLTLSMLELKSNQYLYLKALIILLVITTLSRSSLVAMGLIVIIDLIKNTKLTSEFDLKRTLKLVVLFNIMLAGILAFSYFLSIGRFDTIINNRFTTNDKSANIHFALIDLGMEKITDNLENFLIGYGFGSSYIHTSHFTGGSKYGNFHSEFLTIQLESGVIGLFIYLLIIFVPLFRSKIFKDNYNFFMALMVLAVVLEGIFYQQYLFQYYWLFLIIPWFWQNEEFKLKLTTNTYEI